MPNGSPPITRITFPACRAHYPGGSNGCVCRLLPHPCCLPVLQAGRLPHLYFRDLLRLHSRTARRIAQPPKAAFVTRLRSSRLPDRTARQLPEQSTILWAKSPSTGDPRLRGALQKSRISQHAINACLAMILCCFWPLSKPFEFER